MVERCQIETWITAAKRGDRFALAKLLATCDPRLRARAEARMDAAMRAKRGPDDILQDTYVQVVRRISQFEGSGLAVRCKTVAPDLRVRRTGVPDVKTSDSEVRRYGSWASEGFCTGLLASFLTWAYAILDHKLIDARRAVHRHVRDIQREVAVGAAAADSYWDLLDHLHADSGTPSRAVRRQEALSALVASLADLSESHRQVIELRFLKGLSVAEVAARLGKSEAAVIALTKRALEALRQSMDQLGEFTHGV